MQLPSSLEQAAGQKSGSILLHEILEGQQLRAEDISGTAFRTGISPHAGHCLSPYLKWPLDKKTKKFVALPTLEVKRFTVCSHTFHKKFRLIRKHLGGRDTNQMLCCVSMWTVNTLCWCCCCGWNRRLWPPCRNHYTTGGSHKGD